jgi:hypothetical protein
MDHLKSKAHQKQGSDKRRAAFDEASMLLTGIFGGEVDDVGALISGLCYHSDGTNRNSGLCGHTKQR